MDQPKRRWTPGPWSYWAHLSGSENHKGWALRGAPMNGHSYNIGEMYPLGGDPTEEAKANIELVRSASELADLVERLSQANSTPSTEDQRSMMLGFLAEEARELLKRIKGE